MLTNTSEGGHSYEWFILNEIFYTQDLTYGLCGIDAINEIFISLRITDSLGLCSDFISKVIPIKYTESNCENDKVCNAIRNGDMYYSMTCSDDSIAIHLDNFPSNKERIVCNWSPIIGNPFYCPSDDAIGLYSFAPNGSFPYEEGIAIQDEVDLVDGVTYEVCFKYFVSGFDGLTYNLQLKLTDDVTLSNQLNPSDVIVVNLEDLDPDVNDGTNLTCGWPVEQYHGYSFFFTYDASLGKDFFYFLHDFTGNQGVIYIKDFEVKKCPSTCTTNCDWSFVNDKCDYQFTLDTCDLSGNTWTWDFGFGPTAVGNTTIFTFPISGDYLVCASTLCQNGTELSICKTITVNSESCDDCTNLAGSLGLQCSSNDSIFSFDVMIDVPPGYEICDGNYIYQNDYPFSVENVNSFPNGNGTSFGFYINVFDVDGMFASNGASFTFTFCDTLGNYVCYTTQVSGSLCDECTALVGSVELTCNEEASNDSVFVYCGTYQLLNYNYEGFISNIPGASVRIINQGIPTEVEVCITTMSLSSFNFEINFFLQDIVTNRRICNLVTFNVPDPCPDPPVECDQIWDPKILTCNGSSDRGYETFTFGPMEFWLPYGTQACPGGLSIVTDGNPIITVNQLEIIPQPSGYSKLFFEFDIEMPDFENCMEITLKVIMCDAEGNPICFEYPLVFQCGEEPCTLEGRMQPLFSMYSESVIEYFPNPTNGIIHVAHNIPREEGNLNVMIYSIHGKRVLTVQDLPLHGEIDASSLHNGLYVLSSFVDGQLISTKKIIIQK